MSEKLTARHLERRALIYVRQSSHQQLVHNQESRRLQYEMEKRVRDLGWRETEVIDEDQGRSATSTTGRTGFQRMVAEVCLGKVGSLSRSLVGPLGRSVTYGCSFAGVSGLRIWEVDRSIVWFEDTTAEWAEIETKARTH